MDLGCKSAVKLALERRYSPSNRSAPAEKTRCTFTVSHM